MSSACVWAVEVYNYGTGRECGEGCDTAFGTRCCRKARRQAVLLRTITTTLPSFFDALGGWVCVKSEGIDPRAIVNHLLAGDYYARLRRRSPPGVWMATKCT